MQSCLSAPPFFPPLFPGFFEQVFQKCGDAVSLNGVSITGIGEDKENFGEKALEFIRVEEQPDLQVDAVCQIEAAGSGFLPSGRPKILFEGHVFWRELKKQGYSESRLEALAKANPGILYKRWTCEHYKGGEKECSRLEQARKISETVANASASWGACQIMGNNHAACGHPSVESFVETQGKDSASQLDAFCSFIKNTSGLLPALKAKNWADFAHRYNGPGYAKNAYDAKLLAAYKKSLQARTA